MKPRTSISVAQRRRPTPALAAVAVLAGLIGWRLLHPLQPDSSSFRFDEAKTHTVESVIDGDTLVLAGGTRVRLIGVDTPELAENARPFAREAREFTRSFVKNRRITLGFDRERRDVYHRVLAYVQVRDRLLNEELIRSGYGRAVTRFPYRYSIRKRFLAAEQEARLAGRGLWSQQDLTAE